MSVQFPAESKIIGQVPVFPLNIPLLPHCNLPLQIFERRYLDMVADCLSNGTGFIVTLLKEGNAELEVLRDLPVAANSGDLPFYRVGTFAEITDFGQRDNGLLALSVKGVYRCILADITQQDSGLWVAHAASVQDNGDLDPNLSTALLTYLEAATSEQIWQQLETDRAGISPEQAMNYLITLLPFPGKIKQMLIETDLLEVRQQKLVEFIQLLSAKQRDHN
ncbi:hypothetical protein P886_3177 [Alteromonadaceae bacterium 2753L.S.0a.02]|nr:hypothetical protein P886_3177 [Alteromonadaceae bacterium 2753L.S.0a.02]